VRINITKGYGPNGLGEIRVLKETVKIISADGLVYQIAKENVSEGVPLEGKKRAHFQLDEAETRLMSVRPWDDTHKVKFAGFTRRGRDTEATFYIKRGGPRESEDGRRWVEPDRPRFTAILEIIAGPFKGYTLLYGMDYLFDRSDREPKYAEMKTRRPKWAARVETFMSLCGYDFEVDKVQHSSNILPELEKLLLDRADKNPFVATVEKGWIAREGGLTRMPTGM
jgi:hypothetical protein